MDSNASVYKMMGPVLLRVELDDAKQNVEKRLAFIKTTMYVYTCKRSIYPLSLCLSWMKSYFCGSGLI